MPRLGVTYSEVERAAQEVIASGQEPTIERVRGCLKTGSHSTIARHLQSWRAKQTASQALATKEKIPEELVSLLKGLWDRVMKEAEEKINSITQEAEQARTEYQSTIRTLEQANACLQQSEVKLKQWGEGLNQDKLVLEQMINDRATEIAGLIAKQEGLLENLSEKQIRIEELQRHSEQAQANLEHYREAQLAQRQHDQQRAEQQQRELIQSLQKLQLENETLHSQNLDKQQRYEQLDLTYTHLQAEFEKIMARLNTVSTELTHTRTELAKLSESQQHWKNQYEKISSQWDAEMKTTIELKTHNAVLSDQVEKLTLSLKEMTEKNTMLAHDKWILGQEKAQLFGQLKQWEAMTTKA